MYYINHFPFFSLNFDTQTSADDISTIQNAINSKFNISIWLFTVPAIVIGLIIKKIPAIPALFIGTILGGIAAIIFQTEIITELVVAITTFRIHSLSHGCYGKRC